MSSVSIALVHSWDPQEIVLLYRAGGWWKDEYDPAEIPGLIRGSFAFAVAVEEESGRAVGMGRVISDGVSDAYIQDLVVLPEYRRPERGDGPARSAPWCVPRGPGSRGSRSLPSPAPPQFLYSARIFPHGRACPPDLPG